MAKKEISATTVEIIDKSNIEIKAREAIKYLNTRYTVTWESIEFQIQNYNYKDWVTQTYLMTKMGSHVRKIGTTLTCAVEYGMPTQARYIIDIIYDANKEIIRLVDLDSADADVYQQLASIEDQFLLNQKHCVDVDLKPFKMNSYKTPGLFLHAGEVTYRKKKHYKSSQERQFVDNLLIIADHVEKPS